MLFRSAGTSLVNHPGVDTLHITGSDRTYDAIVFGTGAEGEARKREDRPLVTKPFSAELGNLTPIIVVPGRWSAAELRYHADNVATMLTNNAGFNCTTSRVIVTARRWPQREAFMDMVRRRLTATPTRLAYYPGAHDRFDSFRVAHPEAQLLGTADEGHLPWMLVPGLSPDAAGDPCYRVEAFCSVTAETPIDADDVEGFLARATAFANERLWGTLNATIVVDPRTMCDPAGRPAVELAIEQLDYGAVALNHWSALGYASGVTPWTPGLAFDLPLETMGKRGLRVLRAQQSAEAARWQLAAAAWQVRAGVRDALLNFSDAMQRDQLLSAQYKLQEQFLGRLQERVDAGAIPRSDLTPARVALEKLRLEAAELIRVKGESTVRLAEAVGVPVASLNRAQGIGLAWHFPDATHLTTPEARHRALTHRADIAAALVEYEASQTALRLEIAKQYPDVHLGSGFQWDQGESKWTFLNFSAELPVLNRNQGPIAEAQARRAGAAARVEAAQAKIIAETDAALAAHTAAHGRLNTTELLATEQKRQAANIEAQVRAGALDVLDRIGAQLELAQLEFLRWDAGIKAMQALARLEDALQTPVNSPQAAGAPGSVAETNPRAAKEKP